MSARLAIPPPPPGFFARVRFYFWLRRRVAT